MVMGLEIMVGTMVHQTLCHQLDGLGQRVQMVTGRTIIAWDHLIVEVGSTQ